MLAVVRVVGQVESLPDVAVPRLDEDRRGNIVELAEVGQVRGVNDEFTHSGLELARSSALADLSFSSSPRRYPRALGSRWAMSLRVLLMLSWNSTLLREVLLIWISYSDANSALNSEPSMPAAPAHDGHRVGSRKNSSASIAATVSSPARYPSDSLIAQRASTAQVSTAWGLVPGST